MTFLSDDPAKSGAEMLAIMDDAGWQGSYNFFNVAESMEQSRNILLVIDVFTYGFVILISLIAVANVFNTVSTNVSLRRREFAMLRSVGMTDGGIDRMMNFECVVYGLKALLGGIPVSIAITCLIYRAMFISAEVAFTLPWAGIALSVASVFLVVFVTMLYSVRKVRKINIIEALREDMA
jgi:putative ABC transport system permease protein